MHEFAPRFTRAQIVLLAVLLVLSLAGAGFVTWRIISSHRSSSAVDVDLAQHVISISETTLTVGDADGTTTATAAIPAGFDALIVADQGRWLLEDNRDAAINYFDLSATQPELRTIELPFPGFAIEKRTVRPGKDVVLLYSLDGSLGLAVANLADGTAYPIASARQKYYLAGSVRDYLLFKQVDEPKTVIVPMADPTAFWVTTGAVVDIRGTISLIASVSGLSNFVTIYDGFKPVGVRVQVENPIMGGMLIDKGAVVLEKTGGITIIDNLTGKVKRAGVSEFGAQGAIPVADNRLYGWGGEGSAIVDEAGLPISAYALGTTDAGEQRPLVATNGSTGCLVLQPGPQQKVSGAGGLLISVSDGAELLTLDASPSWVSPDGCTLVGLDSSVVIDGKSVNVDLDQVYFVSPDRRSVLGRQLTDDGSATYVLLDLATKQVTELDPGFHVYATF